jgi:hypothetical protein
MTLKKYIFGNTALVQNCILSKRLDCIYIHLACQKVEHLYGGLREDDISAGDTHWIS